MKWQHNISGFFIIGFLVIGIGLSTPNVWQLRDKSEPFARKDFFEGKWASRYETIYNKNLASFELSKNLWGVLNYTAFGEGSNGVLIGDDGWLFSSEEFERQPESDKNFTRNLQYIKTVRENLSRAGINLIVAPIPAKARLYEDKLGTYHYPAYKKPVYNNFIEAMHQNGIDTANLYNSMQAARLKMNESDQSLFLKTDTHWTPEGAELAASSIAGQIQTKHGDLLAKTEAFEVDSQKPQSYTGDLSRYVPVQMFKALVVAPEEKITLYKTASLDTDMDASMSLFEDKTPEITLVGTSYSANPKWNFEGFLKKHLGVDVLNAADEGMGPFETMKKYLENDAFLQTPPRLVIWEIPERYLTFSYDLDTTESQISQSEGI